VQRNRSRHREDKITAAFKYGVLTVTLPKTEPTAPKSKRIAINGTS
jgi:HSP20 family protein